MASFNSIRALADIIIREELSPPGCAELLLQAQGLVRSERMKRAHAKRRSHKAEPSSRAPKPARTPKAPTPKARGTKRKPFGLGGATDSDPVAPSE